MKNISLEQRYPNAHARRAADEACDKLPDTDTMEHYMSVWNDTYFKVAHALPQGQRL